MTEREQLRELREKNEILDRGLNRTFQRMCCKERECLELRAANANLRVERDAADALLGAAMDEALKARRT
jgi:hypothetical protein